jgi:hypothetical protein
MLPLNQIVEGDCLQVMREWPEESVDLVRDSEGRFIKGYHYCPTTEFKKGQHWRQPKSYWNKDWLENEYVTKKKSAKQIAEEQGCSENNILYFLEKHHIKTRSMPEVREIKHWGCIGKDNPMYGKNGKLHPNWKGGCSPDRQLFYETEEHKEWVRRVFERDNYTCQNCGKRRNSNKLRLQAHHIYSFTEYPEKRLNLDNGLTLCKECHDWVHSNENMDSKFLGG